MRLLIYEWESYWQYDIEQVCFELGITYHAFQWKFIDKNYDEKFEKWFCDNIELRTYDALLSINYYPLLSCMCQKYQVPYIAWCYDNPLNVINMEETLINPVNYVVFFDRIQTQYYLNKGFHTVHYLPLGVNKTRMQETNITKQDRIKYSADVSLVGSLYESKLDDILAISDDYSAGFIRALLDVQQNIYGYYLFDELITNDFVRNMNHNIQKKFANSNFELVKEALTFAMASEVTRKERLLILSLMAKRFDTRLYSFQFSEVLRDVKVCSAVDYISEMPKVFACSKINLNPTLRCIQSGIPLRALDVMASGGFLLSSFQPELVEYFSVGEELEVYESMGNALEKATFYLKHEELRKKIGLKAKVKVLTEFSMQEELKNILHDVLG